MKTGIILIFVGFLIMAYFMLSYHFAQAPQSHQERTIYTDRPTVDHFYYIHDRPYMLLTINGTTYLATPFDQTREVSK